MILDTCRQACSALATRRPSRRFGILVLVLVLSACTAAQTTRPGAIGLDRTQRFSTFLSEQELEQGAAQAYRQVLTKAQGEGNLNSDARMTQRVRAIADRLKPHVAVFREDALNWNWEANVIESDQLNAWAMPGGKIAFYSGIIEQLQLTDAEIAAIMGHEIAHALREHSRERASEQQISGLLLNGGVLLGSILTGTDLSGLGQGVQLGLQVGISLPNSRLHETEADRVGIELMARAGYDPRGAIRVWQKMAQKSGGKGGPQFMSTHPSPESRIADLTDYARRVMPLYQQADKAPG